MLEIARPETRLQAGTRAGRPAWGIVDVILALVLLPFAIGMWIIDRMVWVIAATLGG
jgi:hypothetical protein